MPVLSMKISEGLEMALYEADTALQQLFKYIKELSPVEHFEIKELHSEFDIIRRALEKRK